MRVLPAKIRLWLFRLSTVPFAVALALVGVNTAIRTVILPRASPPVRFIKPPLDYIWAGMYGLGGLLIILGIASVMINVEAAGCIAFCGGALVNLIVGFAAYGSAWVGTSLVLLAFVIASAIRAWHLAQGYVLILAKVSPKRRGMQFWLAVRDSANEES